MKTIQSGQSEEIGKDGRKFVTRISSAEFSSILDELTGLIRALGVVGSDEVAELLTCILKSGLRGGCIYRGETPGTGDLVTVFDVTDEFLEFLSAMRAGDRPGLVILKEFGHRAESVADNQLQ